MVQEGSVVASCPQNLMAYSQLRFAAPANSKKLYTVIQNREANSYKKISFTFFKDICIMYFPNIISLLCVFPNINSSDEIHYKYLFGFVYVHT